MTDNWPRWTVIIGPPPTPNGDLHVGHIAGPYLAADVHARYLRLRGRPVIYASGTDDSQTYVVASAKKLGTTPEALAEKSWREIKATLGVMGIALDGFAPFDDDYRAAVLDFVGKLHSDGKLRKRRVRLPYDEQTEQFLMEGLVEGGCPVCLAQSRGGLCESCGHPNNFDELLEPHSTTDPAHSISSKEVEILVLPLEEYRSKLSEFHAEKAATWRPHIVGLIRELLAKPLPDFPITYPTSWGIAAPFPEVHGQVINAWVEGMPASMYCTEFGSRQLGESPASYDELWRAERNVQLVYFLGFDNAYFWGLTHLALLLAHDGKYVVPDFIVCNEFYELENEKFSTSKGHVVWAKDLLDEIPRDLARFYLTLTAPEHSRTNFSRGALEKITTERLVVPWNELAELIGKVSAQLGAGAGGLGCDADSRGVLAVSETAMKRVSLMFDRFAGCYELVDYSLSRAADLIVTHTDRLRHKAIRLVDELPGLSTIDAERGLADLLAEVAGLISAASPILIDLADNARRAGWSLADHPAKRVHALAVPMLPGVQSMGVT
ncbi:MAG: class I tRNA ligase family protein [Sciscionella sp.]|nr:class I tRNA ligase family protein [Sciscionella sp.]